MRQCQVDNVEEVQKAKPAKITSITTNNVPPQKCIWIIQITAGHSSQSEKVLREESQVHTLKEQEEVCLSMVLWILASSLFTYPKIKSCKNSKYSSHTQYIMEMSYNIVSIVQCYIHSPICQYNSGKSSNSKLNLESQSKQHRGRQPQGSPIQSSKPRENFDSSRHSNNHRCTCKICTSIYVQTNCIHVVCPNLESKNGDRSHGIHHSYIPKNGFTRKKTQHVANDTKGRLNQNVYFRVSEEPEQVLIQYNITSTCRQKERSIKVSVCLKHSQSRCKYRKAPNQLDTHKTKGPYKQRYAIKGHTLCTHVRHGDQKIHRPLNTANTRNVQTKNSLVNRSTRVAQSTTKRRICSPPYTRSLFHQSALEQQRLPGRQHPERHVIHAGKCHIWRADHDRHKPISESPHQSRHYNKKQHQQSVCSNQDVVELSISCQNTGSSVPLFHTNLLTHGCCHDTSPASKNKVQHTNVFCVGATAPTQKHVFQIRLNFHLFFMYILSKTSMRLYSIQHARNKTNHQNQKQTDVDAFAHTYIAAMPLGSSAFLHARRKEKRREIARLPEFILGILECILFWQQHSGSSIHSRQKRAH